MFIVFCSAEAIDVQPESRLHDSNPNLPVKAENFATSSTMDAMHDLLPLASQRMAHRQT
jgi:hypothetical protein